MAPSFSVFGTASPVTLMALSPVISRLPAQTCTPMVLVLMVLLSMVSVPLLGK